MYPHSRNLVVSIPLFSSRVTGIAPTGRHEIGVSVVTHPCFSTVLYGSLLPLKTKRRGAHDPFPLITRIIVTRFKFRNSGIRRSLKPERGMSLFKDVTQCTSRSGLRLSFQIYIRGSHPHWSRPSAFRGSQRVFSKPRYLTRKSGLNLNGKV